MKIIEDWVANSSDQDSLFRQAVHLILLAISRDRGLSRKLVIKGGIAMSIIYSSDRFTTDIDLSALDNIQDLSKEDVEESLSRQLKAVVALSDYNIDLNIHSIKPSPKHIEKATFPAYKATIGYADSTNANAIKRLEDKNAPQTVSLDISFNEELAPEYTEAYKLDERHHVLVYSLEQLVAEKYRSLLQQVKRKRNRRQDIYDIYHLLNDETNNLQNESVKKTILERLIISSKNRDIEEYLNANALQDGEIRKRALEDFDTLKSEIKVRIPAEKMYKAVQEYFESLPWNEIPYSHNK